jgi:hypothetical protein
VRLPDSAEEGAETVVVTIQPAPSTHVVGPSGSAAVTIADDPPAIAASVW